MTLDITQFYQTFFDEADELLAQMEGLLLGLDVGAPDPEDLAAIFRAAHSIKGGAATFGFTALTETTHILESLLDRARNREIALTRPMVDAFLETKDVLSEQLADYRASAEPDATAAAQVCAKLEALNRASQPADGGACAADQASAPAAQFACADAQDGAPAAHADVPEHVVDQVCAALHSPAGAAPRAGARDETEGPHLKVSLRTGNQHDRQLLQDELGNLGQIVECAAEPECLTIWLESDVPAADIVAVCCFVIDESEISVAYGLAPSIAGEPASEPVAAAVEDAAPSFDPSPAPAAPAEHTDWQATAPAPAGQPPAGAQGPAPAAAGAEERRARPAAVGAEGTSIRVGVEKVDQLINLVGELVITQAMLAQTASAFDPAVHDRLFNGMAQLERNARDLQEAVMSIRMMPMDYVFSRFPRLVRDLASKLGKQVELVTFGQATELDKSLIERIIDPLTHLVRNSLDHGIETVDRRIAAGKAPVGQLVLSAAHAGGNIVIEVSDDGAGLNRERILAKAAKQGMHIADNISDEDVWSLIFAPGFSTAETVTDVSGRGVGMDVVKRNIQEMGGHVEIASQAGRGTTTRIILPLTLAILDGMSVKVGEEIFILPLNCVMESLQPAAEDIYTVGNGERVVRVRGEYLSLVMLHEVFAVENARTDPVHGIITIMQSEGRRFAMLVDELVGQQQVVVKNLETNYRKVHGVSAATILGDGSVALIVDVPALNRAHAGSGVHHEIMHAEAV